jgi:hypothetical protein
MSLPWTRAALLGAAWAGLATVVNVTLWMVWLGPGTTSLAWLLLSPGVCLVVAGLVHRSARVALLTGMLTVALNALAFVLLVVVALNVLHGRD